MKQEILSFKIVPMKRRNHIAQDLLDRDGPYKPKKVKNLVQYQRREKHKNRIEY